ncbi:MAG: hypothetical protein ACRC33_04835 [Gemmataceae bacterium]
MFALRILSLAFLVAVLAGCGGPPAPTTVKVSGKLSYDGKPVDKGSVSFLPLSGGQPPDVLTVVGGMFEGDVTVGKKKLEFYSFVPGKAPPKDTPGGDGPITMNILPAQYNSESKEAKDITAPGPHSFDFNLAK